MIINLLKQQLRSVFTPIIFFDLFDMPIPKNHLYNLVYQTTITQIDLNKNLQHLRQQEIIDCDNQLIWLAKRSNILRSYHERLKQNQQLKKSAYHEIKQLGRIPFVKLVCITNSLALSTATDKSDIDLLIVTSDNRLGICRDWINLMLGFTGQRATGGSKRGRIAIDIWLEESTLDLRSFRMTEDIYFDFWFAHLLPILDRDQTFAKLIKANQWIFHSFPNLKYRKVDNIITRKGAITHWRESILRGKIGDALNNWLVNWQLKRLEKFFDQRKEPKAIRLSKSQLRFNIPDRRQEYQKKFNQKLQVIERQLAGS